jgi:cobalt-zinc-cadmium efflux system protein
MNGLLLQYTMNTHIHHTHHHGGHAHPHIKDHGNAFIIGIILNTLFVSAEIIYGLQANSLALLADAGHNASDVLGLVMAWVATLLARREASERFTYGLQSLSIFASFANALLLLVVVGGIGFEALGRFNNPHTPATTTVMVVASIGVAINGLTAWLFYGHNKHDLNVQGAFLHMAADAAISLGVVLSGLVILSTGWDWLDPLTSLAIVTIIIASTWQLLKGSTALALQAVPDHIDISQVRGYLAGLAGVRELHDLHIWAMSTTGVALSAHLVMPAGHPGDRFLHDIRSALEERFTITHATIQIEMGDMGEECHTGCEHEHDHSHDHHHAHSH